MAQRKLLRPVIFIDRDGVINKDPIGDYIKTWKKFVFLPGVLKALRLLTQAEYQIIIISNQAGIGDGVFKKEALQDITKKMLAKMRKNKIKIAAVFYCLHGKQAGCKCRKPEIGLFLKAAGQFKFNKKKTYFVGDKATDVTAGKRFGIKNAFVLTGHGKFDRKLLKSKPEILAPNLLSAVRKILSHS